jgi:5-methylcytosine-specific restriction endonuclease McrA
LREANHIMLDVRLPQESDDKDTAMATYASIIEICTDLEKCVESVKVAAHHKHIALRREPRTERAMTNFIMDEMEKPTVKVKASNKEVAAGGQKAAALREAGGRCELCKAEWHLTYHHIIARAAGGLSEQDNIIVLCKSCHDEIEPLGLTTRSAILRYDRTRDRQAPPPQEKSRAEKIAMTKAQTAIDERKEMAELDAWAAERGDPMIGVQYWSLGDPEIVRPEKNWHVIVYGAGRSYAETLRKEKLDS